MPPQVVKTSLMQKLGAKAMAEAHEAYKAAPPPSANMDAPAGIDNGIAQLRGCGFTTIGQGKTNAGAVLFTAYGVIVQPTHHDTIPVAGLRTTIMETVANTPQAEGERKTIKDHMGWVYGQLKLLGVKTELFDFKKNPNALEDACATLVKLKPLFRFRTWKGKKQTTGKYANMEPRTNHQWGGLVTMQGALPSANGAAAAAVTEDTVEAIGETGVVMDEQPPDETPPFNEFENPNDSSGDTSATDTGEVDLNALAEACSGDDDDATVLAARAELTKLANDAGVTDDQITATQTWQEVVDLITTGGTGSTEDGAADTNPYEVGVNCKYEITLIDPKTKKPMVDPKTKKAKKKSIEATITETDADKKVATLKSLEDGKTLYKAIPYDKILLG